ncbi:uncharacterized protein BKA78DRAFT_22771 [Phyllosticta capitalensis]|uniref:uncharacterized protein n=1 Tax=Phyllosticta capitalensis TaxID=121624 RepID=UPI00312D92DF
MRWRAWRRNATRAIVACRSGTSPPSYAALHLYTHCRRFVPVCQLPPCLHLSHHHACVAFFSTVTHYTYTSTAPDPCGCCRFRWFQIENRTRIDASHGFQALRHGPDSTLVPYMYPKTRLCLLLSSRASHPRPSTSLPIPHDVLCVCHDTATPIHHLPSLVFPILPCAHHPSDLTSVLPSATLAFSPRETNGVCLVDLPN